MKFQKTTIEYEEEYEDEYEIMQLSFFVLVVVLVLDIKRHVNEDYLNLRKY
ncbi:MAG: hypothetical protein PVG06_18675 [Desulfobacterales bacterium]